MQAQEHQPAWKGDGLVREEESGELGAGYKAAQLHFFPPKDSTGEK